MAADQTPPSVPSAKSATQPGPQQQASPQKQPTEFPPAVRKTVTWLQNAFTKAYRQVPPPMPDRFTRREFGYILWPDRPGPPPFVRHKAFGSAGEFHRFLARGAPHSLYYSTAYYRRPSDLKMADKQWLGAELIFDLDADHLADVEKAKAEGKEVPLPEQLRQVKEQFKRLLDEFLFGDFGLGASDVWITFSGGRGYHAHVVEPRLLQLESKGRREIVDYITGKFPVDREGTMNLAPHIVPVLADTKGRGEFAKGVYQIEVPTTTAPGWGGRLTRGVVSLLDEHVAGVERREAMKWLQAMPGVGAKRAEKFLEKYHDGQVRARLTGELVTKHQQMQAELGKPVWRVILSAESSVLEAIYRQAAVTQAIPLEKGETDEPVTADTKRLIRLPGSLHGKTGLRCVILDRDQLDGFDPLRDAVAFGADPVRIKPRADAEMTLGGERVAVKAGVETEVPERHAVFWLARQGGTIVLPP